MENKCNLCGEELYAGRCLSCNPKQEDKGGLLPRDYFPGDPFW